MMYQMATTMTAPMFSDVIAFFGVFNSLKFFSVGDDFEFPIFPALDLLECRVLLPLFIGVLFFWYVVGTGFLGLFVFFSFSFGFFCDFGVLCRMWDLWVLV